MERRINRLLDVLRIRNISARSARQLFRKPFDKLNRAVVPLSIIGVVRVGAGNRYRARRTLVSRSPNPVPGVIFLAPFREPCREL